ncbi:recombinase family protein [Oryzomonas sagensis]|uniref:Recombinase family protein n=1 Tax=Oryzomonas sagensis TaxID=2603857 RepID=A0ABQ6TP77_9BACT|nr:recombinase family protein [Oryzomonas sagensis]KAB0670085.1 recombinase family protein [Oryzomonas sagensis]
MRRTGTNNKKHSFVNRVVVSYVRVSSKEQEKEGFSVEAQTKLLASYASDRKLVIDKEFRDIETAKRTGRLGFNEMVGFLKKSQKANPAASLVIITEKTDRLYRNIGDWSTLDGLHAEIHLVKENCVLSDDSRSAEKLMHGIRVVMAKNYVENLSEETRKGMLEKAQQGLWPSFAPFGYKNVLSKSGKKVIVPDETTAPLVTKIFDLYATGNHSLDTIVKQLSGLNYRSRMRRRKKKRQDATGETILEEGPETVQFGKSLIHKILTSVIYTGDFFWNGIKYSGSHESIISPEQFEKVQQLLSGNGRCPSQPAKHHFLFQGLIACGHCGCALVAEIKKGKYIYYHCTKNRGNCPAPYVREEELERRFLASIEAIKVSDDVLKWVVAALKESYADERREHQEVVSALLARKQKLSDYLEAAYTDKLDGVISSDFYEKKTREWRAEQDDIRRKLEIREGASRSYIDDGVRVLELSQRAGMLYKMQPVEEKRKLLKILHSNSVWKDGELVCSYRKPFDLLALTNNRHKQKQAGSSSETGLRSIWLPNPDSNQGQGG